MPTIEAQPNPQLRTTLSFAEFRSSLNRAAGIRTTDRGIESHNFVSGSVGWRWTAEGNLEANDGTFRGTIVATTGTIGGFTIGATSLSTSGLVMDSDPDEFLIGTASNRVIAMTSSGLRFYTTTVINAQLGLPAANTLSITSGDPNGVGPISVLFERTGSNAGVVRPDAFDTIDLGNATTFYNDVSYKTLTDRGCLGWFDEGVEMQDGSIVSDTEALLAIRKHPTKLTVYGKPMLDYTSLPKDVYKPATDGEGNLYERTKENKPKAIRVNGKWVYPQDGAETTALISIMIGALKENTLEIRELKKQLAQ